jgi:IPT/TIG domain
MQRQEHFHDWFVYYCRRGRIGEPIKITSINPTVGLTGGCRTEVTIMGKNFQGRASSFRLMTEKLTHFRLHAGAIQVKFGDTLAPIISSTNEYVSCLAPPCDEPRTIRVTILSNLKPCDEKDFTYLKGILKSHWYFPFSYYAFSQFCMLL